MYIQYKKLCLRTFEAEIRQIFLKEHSASAQRLDLLIKNTEEYNLMLWFE